MTQQLRTKEQNQSHLQTNPRKTLLSPADTDAREDSGQ